MQVDIGPDGFQSCCRFVTIIPPNRGKTGYRDEIWWPDCLDIVSGQPLVGDCLRESNHLDAAGARGSNPLVPAKNIEGRSDTLTKNDKKSFPEATSYNTIDRVLTPGLNFSFRVSEVTGRRGAGRRGFGPPHPRPGYFLRANRTRAQGVFSISAKFFRVISCPVTAPNVKRP
jgi:hypothetical protein